MKQILKTNTPIAEPQASDKDDGSTVLYAAIGAVAGILVLVIIALCVICFFR